MRSVLLLFVVVLVGAHKRFHPGHDNEGSNEDQESPVTQIDTFNINEGELQRTLWSHQVVDGVEARMTISLESEEEGDYYFMLLDSTEYDNLGSHTYEIRELCAFGLTEVDVNEVISIHGRGTEDIIQPDLHEGRYFLKMFNCLKHKATVTLKWKLDSSNAGLGEEGSHDGSSDRDSDSHRDGGGDWNEDGGDWDGDSGWGDWHGWHHGSGWRWVENFEKEPEPELSYNILYTVETGAFGMAAIAWIANWFKYRRCNTKLQKFATFVPLTRVGFAVSGFLLVQEYQRYAEASLPTEYAAFIFDIFHNVAFYMALQYAAVGLSTKKTNISCKKKLIATVLAAAVTGTFTSFEAFAGNHHKVFLAAGCAVSYIVMFARIFITSKKTTGVFLKEVQALQRDGKTVEGSASQTKLEEIVMFRFFVTIYVGIDLASRGVTHFALGCAFAEACADGAKEFIAMVVLGYVFRVRPFNTVGIRRSRHRRRFLRRSRRRMESSSSYQDIGYVGMDDLPPNNVAVSIASAPNAFVVAQRVQEHYPTWKCEKCTFLNEGPMTHCQSCEVWSCGTCTYDNPMASELCAVCDRKRPEDVDNDEQEKQFAQNVRPDHWKCDKCNFTNPLENEYCEECETWTCLSCTYKNELSAATCVVCSKSRPSDVALNLHKEVQKQKRAIAEADQQVYALREKLNERGAQAAGDAYPVVRPMMLEQKAQEVIDYQPRMRQDYSIAQAAPDSAAVEFAESVELDALDPMDSAAPGPVKIMMKEPEPVQRDIEEEYVAMRSVVSDDAIIVYDTPQGPPKMVEMTDNLPKDLMDSRMMSSVSGSSEIIFDEHVAGPAAPGLRTRVTVINLPEPVVLEVEESDDLTEAADDTSDAVEDFLHLNDNTTVMEPATEEPEAEEEQESESPSTEIQVDGVNLLQFLMESNTNGDLSDDDLAKLMKQIREKPEDKQTLLESLDAAQGNKVEFFKMVRLFGFIA